MLNMIASVFLLTTSINNDTIDNLNTTTEAVGSFAKMIDQYGYLIVVMAVFLVVFIAAVGLILKHNNNMISNILEEKTKMSDNLMKQNDDLIGKLLNNEDVEDEGIHKEVKEEAKKSINSYIDINMILKDTASFAAEKLGCDRVGIYVFHNGSKSIHGFPFFKMTCISEWAKNGSVAMKTKIMRSMSHNQMPLHMFVDIVEQLYKNDEYIVSDVTKEIETNKQLDMFMAYTNIKSLYAHTIKSNNGEIGGFIIAEYSTQQDFSNPKILEIVQDTVIDACITIHPIVIHVQENQIPTNKND